MHAGFAYRVALCGVECVNIYEMRFMQAFEKFNLFKVLCMQGLNLYSPDCHTYM